MKLTKQQKAEITKMSRGFAKGILGKEPIDGSSWVVVDPLSAFLSVCGYENKLSQIPHPETGQPILIIEFPDGSQFVPAGKDLKHIHPAAKNYMWL